MKLLIVLPHLRGGGAQRVAVNLINHLDRDISLNLFLINNDGFLINFIEKDIQIFTSKAKKTKNALFELKKIIDQHNYDAIFTMKDYLGFLVCITVAMTKSKPPIIYREVIHKSASDSCEIKNNIIRNIWYYIERFVYKKVNKIIVPSYSMKLDLKLNYKISETKIKVINNPVDIKKIIYLAKQDVDHPWFTSTVPLVIGMGRLTGQKGFYELIKAVKLVNDKNIILRLVIIGVGEEKPRLKIVVDELQLNDRVDFLGAQENPYKFIARADMFVSSSFYEGFPNALLEAMACDTVIISTDCLSGPAEIINNYENGILVPVGDVEKIAEEIANLIENPQLAEHLSTAAKKTVLEKYAANVVAKEYQAVFADLIQNIESK